MANYVIVGAGRDASHPIQANVRCDDSTTICWIGKYCKTVCDVEMCTEDQYCETVSTTSEGPHQTTWTDPDGVSHTIYYNVTRNCPPVVPPSCEYTCSDLTAYAVPSSVVESYTGNVDIHYEYYLTCVSGDYIGDRVKKSGVKTVAFSEFTNYSYSLSVDGCSTTVNLDKKGGDDCTVGCVADISITFSQDIVPASGKTIQVIVSFKKTVTDENCKKKVTTGSFSYPWEVKCTPVDENDKHCCKDHYVQGWISAAEVKRLGKLDGCELRYDGEQTALDFYYKVLQRGKTTEECEGYCEEKTTYCVDQSTVKVCYEKRYLSNEWVCEGDPSTDCDCTALSIEGVNGAYSVPFTGGRIKVTWQYSAHTTTETCNEYDTLGKTWEEIITIGGCDERPIDCKPEYNTVVVDDQGHTAIYDDTTYKDCEICDSECCYNYDGKGTCKCVILFKEQTPGCTTCESCDVYDEEEQRTITYNKIRYEFVQDCTTICNYDKNTQFEQKEINVDKCFTGETAATVPFTSTTEYYGAGCPAPEVIIDSVEAKANIPTVNNSNRPKVAYEDDMIKVIQAAGPCEVPTYCDCDALTLEGGGGGDCPEGEISYVYGTVNIECRKYVNEEVQVRYTKYCDGTPIGSGTTAKTISVDCNKGVARDITVSGVILHQAGGCTDEQCGATPPGSDCACSVTWGGSTPTDRKDLSYFETLYKEPFGHGDLSTGNTHTYLNAIYNKANSDFTNNTGGYTLSIYNDSGIKTCSNTGGDEDMAFNIFIGWTIAMSLTEIDASKSDELYDTAYSTFGGDTSVFGYSTKNNPHIARIAATIEYATSRPNWDTLVTNVRTEKGVYSNATFDPTTIVRNTYGDYYPDTSNIVPSLSFIMENCQPCDTEIDNDAKSRYTNDNPTVERTKQALMDKDFCGTYGAKIFGDAMGMNINNRADLIEEYLTHGSWASDAVKDVYYGRYRPPRYPNNVQYNGYPLVNKTIEDLTGCEVHPEMTPQVAANNMYPNSYSSGHSSAIWGIGCILAYIYPSKYVEIFKRAWVFANNRVVSRYHFYSDTIVGRELGGLILPTLMYYDKFRNSL